MHPESQMFSASHQGYPCNSLDMHVESQNLQPCDYQNLGKMKSAGSDLPCSGCVVSLFEARRGCTRTSKTLPGAVKLPVFARGLYRLQNATPSSLERASGLQYGPQKGSACSQNQFPVAPGRPLA